MKKWLRVELKAVGSEAIEAVLDVLSIVDTEIWSVVVDGKYDVLWEVFFVAWETSSVDSLRKKWQLIAAYCW
jgi:hypothetical protein